MGEVLHNDANTVSQLPDGIFSKKSKLLIDYAMDTGNMPAFAVLCWKILHSLRADLLRCRQDFDVFDKLMVIIMAAASRRHGTGPVLGELELEFHLIVVQGRGAERLDTLSVLQVSPNRQHIFRCSLLEQSTLEGFGLVVEARLKYIYHWMELCEEGGALIGLQNFEESREDC